MKTFYINILLFICVVSCDLSIKRSNIDPIARVNNFYLTSEDIDHSLFDELNKEDSLFQIQNIINDWATRKLLEDGAYTNLNVQKQQKFESLIQNYKSDLYTSAYIEALVKKNLDTVISNEQHKEFYKKNEELFVLNEDLVKLRYINHDVKMSNASEIRSRFISYNSEDKAVLDTLSVKFKSFFLNDSVWVKWDEVINKIKPLKKYSNKVLLKKLNFVEFKDTLGLYLVKVNEVINTGKKAPISYALPTIEQIILNRRKLKLINQLKSEIVNDAIKNKKFEIY